MDSARFLEFVKREGKFPADANFDNLPKPIIESIQELEKQGLIKLKIINGKSYWVTVSNK